MVAIPDYVKNSRTTGTTPPQVAARLDPLATSALAGPDRLQAVAGSDGAKLPPCLFPSPSHLLSSAPTEEVLNRPTGMRRRRRSAPDRFAPAVTLFLFFIVE
jgi:hypothetical protein